MVKKATKRELSDEQVFELLRQADKDLKRFYEIREATAFLDEPPVVEAERSWDHPLTVCLDASR
jgi:hypothetical protein